MKTPKCEMKNELYDIKDRLDIAQEINGLGDTAIEAIKNEALRKIIFKGREGKDRRKGRLKERVKPWGAVG